MSLGNESQRKIICIGKGGEMLGRNSIDSNLYTFRTWHNEEARGRKCRYRLLSKRHYTSESKGRRSF